MFATAVTTFFKFEMLRDLFRSFPSFPCAPVLALLILTSGVDSLKESECDYTLSDSPKAGKVVHTFKTSCYEGEILWRYPFSGLELTFRKPSSPAYATSAVHRSSHPSDSRLQFCYVVEKTMTNPTMLRELPGPTFLPGETESCLDFDLLTSAPVKFYIESTPSQNSSLMGKFQLHYIWSKPTPFEQCRRCTAYELNAATCRAGNIFTGRIERPFRRHGLTVSVKDILRFDHANVPKRFCTQRKGKLRTTIPHQRHAKKWDFQVSSKHPKCDKIMIPDTGKCSIEKVLSVKRPEDEFIFIADTVLRRFRPRCVLHVEKFWKTWKKMEAQRETDCLL